MTNFEIIAFISMLIGFRSMYTYKRDLKDYRKAIKEGSGISARYFMSGVILMILSVFIFLYFMYKILVSFID